MVRIWTEGSGVFGVGRYAIDFAEVLHEDADLGPPPTLSFTRTARTRALTRVALHVHVALQVQLPKLLFDASSLGPHVGALLGADVGGGGRGAATTLHLTTRALRREREMRAQGEG